MTTNIDRAARALYDHRLTVGDFPDGVTEWKDLPDPWKDEWREAADALADAGLLAPDLPEPIINTDDGNPEWHADEYTVDVDQGRVWVNMWTPDGIHWEQTPNQARELADALYAASDHAEEAGHAQDD